jgi:hypothetical protein
LPRVKAFRISCFCFVSAHVHLDYL